jgi:hypothetical protein
MGWHPGERSTSVLCRWKIRATRVSLQSPLRSCTARTLDDVSGTNRYFFLCGTRVYSEAGSLLLRHDSSETAFWQITPCGQRRRAGGLPCLLLCRLALFFLSAQQRFFRGGDPSRTELRNPADELHRNRFGEWEMNRPLSQLIAPEFIFERREERP